MYRWTYLIIRRILDEVTPVCFKILYKRLPFEAPHLRTPIKRTQIPVRYWLIMLAALVRLTHLAVVLVLFWRITFPVFVLPVLHPSIIDILASGSSVSRESLKLEVNKLHWFRRVVLNEMRRFVQVTLRKTAQTLQKWCYWDLDGELQEDHCRPVTQSVFLKMTIYKL